MILSAFFSGTETAYFHIRKYRKETPDNIKSILDYPQRLLVSLLTGNTIVNVVIASLAAYITANIAHKYQWSDFTLILIEVLVVSIVVLIFGEILPKMIAIRQSNKFAERVYRPLKIMMSVLYPIAQAFNSVTSLIMKVLPVKKEKIFDSEEELKMLAELGEEEGALQEEESDMIQSIFDFTEKTVGEIVTPRVDIVALKSDESIDTAMDIIGKRQFSKIPIYKDSVDNIKGILYAKDIIPYLMGSRPNVNLQALAREPFFVPETKPIDDLMEEFKIRKTSIAIVVDEWGGTEGLVTLEDVVEEVMGELSDPFDSEEYEVIKQKDGSIIVDGSIKIYDLEENLEIDFPDDREYDTLAGLILDLTGDIPKKGQVVTFEKYSFKVIKLDSNRVDKIEINQNK